MRLKKSLNFPNKFHNEQKERTVKEIIRQCTACKQKYNRSLFFRVLLDHESGEYILEPNRFQFGRSFYLCKNRDCVNKFSKNKKYKNKVDLDKILDSIREKVTA